MGFVTMLIAAVGLAMDAFAVSLGVGAGKAAGDPRAMLRLSFHMGFFQGFMAFLGWLLGFSVARWVNTFGPWIALGLLCFVGTRMIRSGLSCEEEDCGPDPTHGGAMLMVCIATSIDAMAVGLGMAMLKNPILAPSLVIGVVTFALSGVGLLLGSQLGSRFGKRMEMVGGLLLNGIGIRILLSFVL
jgi:putative Mn2+ efflux pump MntP